MRGALCSLFLVTVCSLLLAATARADGIKINQRLMDADGWPILNAGYSPYYEGLGTVSWKVCAPDCGPVVATGTFYKPGPTEPGTSFEASVTVNGQTTAELSPPWLGQLTNTVPPTFEGELRPGQTLTPRAGTWSGGWGDEGRLLGMRACPTAAAEDCRAMNAASLQPWGPSEVTIDPAYAGWYIGAIESRFGWGAAFPAIGIPFMPGQVSRWRSPSPSQTVAAGPLSGPIPAPPAPPPPPAAADPEQAPRFTPRVMLGKRAMRRAGSLVLGTIICARRCVARTTLRHGRKAVTRRIVVTGGRASIKLLRGAFSRRATEVRVAVRFDRHPATASGSVKLR